MTDCRLLTLLLAIAAVLAPADADAQFYRRGRGGSVIVRAPFVGVNVTPGGVSVRAPGVSVNTPRSGYGYAAPVPSGPVYYGTPITAPTPAVVVDQPVVTSPPTPVTSQRPVPPSMPVQPSMSEADLAALDTAGLLAALANKSAELDAELGALSGGDGWQKYLALPSGVAAGAADVVLLKKLLARFDSIARDRQFSMIAGLNGFEPTRTVLRVVVDRLESAPAQPPVARPPVAPPAAGEPLPAPSADEAPAEKSVLKL